MSNRNDFSFGGFWGDKYLVSGYHGKSRDMHIPDDMRTIGDYAFQNNTNIATVSIPDSVTTICRYAFDGCSSLESVEFMGTTLRIYPTAFRGCTNVRAFFAPNLPFDVVQSSGIQIAAALSFIERRSEYTDEKIVNDYMKYVFSQKKKILLTAFRYDAIRVLGFYSENGKLTAKNIVDDFLNPAIEAGATQCAAFLMELKSKIVPDNYEEKKIERELNRDPFSVTEMKKIWQFENLSDGTIAITGYKGDDAEIIVPAQIGKKAITEISDEAFSSGKPRSTPAQKKTLAKVVSITLPDSIKKIGTAAFKDCKNLSVINIPQSLTRIPYWMFSGCESLESITLPDGITEIGGYAFENCKKLKNIAIPESVVGIGNGCFNGCDSIPPETRPKHIVFGKETYVAKCGLEFITQTKAKGFLAYYIKSSALVQLFKQFAEAECLRSCEITIDEDNNTLSIIMPNHDKVCELWATTFVLGNYYHHCGLDLLRDAILKPDGESYTVFADALKDSNITDELSINLLTALNKLGKSKTRKDDFRKCVDFIRIECLYPSTREYAVLEYDKELQIETIHGRLLDFAYDRLKKYSNWHKDSNWYRPI